MPKLQKLDSDIAVPEIEFSGPNSASFRKSALGKTQTSHLTKSVHIRPGASNSVLNKKQASRDEDTSPKSA